LGSDAYHQALARGALRTEGNDPDILDVLMQMDWAVSWLKQAQKTSPPSARKLAWIPVR
jgi:hypothetical protein